MTFQGACLAILTDPKADPYARTYARAGLSLTGNPARVQALYILSNLSRWRHPDAKLVRATLRRIGEVER